MNLDEVDKIRNDSELAYPYQKDANGVTLSHEQYVDTLRQGYFCGASAEKEKAKTAISNQEKFNAGIDASIERIKNTSLPEGWAHLSDFKSLLANNLTQLKKQTK